MGDFSTYANSRRSDRAKESKRPRASINCTVNVSWFKIRPVVAVPSLLTAFLKGETFS